MRTERWLIILLVGLMIMVAGCGSDRSELERGPLRVVATTTIVGDVVRQVGGEHIELEVLLPRGADPHSYTPTPQDAAKIANAEIIFINGLGLESFLDDLIRQAGTNAEVVTVSAGVLPRRFKADLQDSKHKIRIREDFEGVDEESAEDEHTAAHDHDYSGIDPHVWMDPHNVMIWVANIQETLGKRDPIRSEIFVQNAQSYKTQLIELDSQVLRLVERLNPLMRRLITSHLFLGYFADRYGFTQVEAIMPAASVLAEPSAKDLVKLQEMVRRTKVPVIFTGQDVTADLANRIGSDLSVAVEKLYVGSLSEPGEGAGAYIEYMDYNVRLIVNGLNQSRTGIAP